MASSDRAASSTTHVGRRGVLEEPLTMVAGSLVEASRGVLEALWRPDPAREWYKVRSPTATFRCHTDERSGFAGASEHGVGDTCPRFWGQRFCQSGVGQSRGRTLYHSKAEIESTDRSIRVIPTKGGNQTPAPATPAGHLPPILGVAIFSRRSNERSELTPAPANRLGGTDFALLPTGKSAAPDGGATQVPTPPPVGGVGRGHTSGGSGGQAIMKLIDVLAAAWVARPATTESDPGRRRPPTTPPATTPSRGWPAGVLRPSPRQRGPSAHRRRRPQRAPPVPVGRTRIRLRRCKPRRRPNGPLP